MTRVLKFSGILALLSFTVLCLYTIDLEHELSVAAPAEVAKLNASIGAVKDFAEGQKIPVQKLVAQWTGVPDLFNQMLAKERDAQKAQLDSINQASSKVNLLLDTATDDLKKAAPAIDSIATIAPALTNQINQIGTDIHLTLVATREMVTALTADLNDPDVKLSFAQVAQLTAALRDAAVKGDAIMLDLKKIGDHYEIQIDTPATKGQKFIAGARIAARIVGDLIIKF